MNSASAKLWWAEIYMVYVTLETKKDTAPHPTPPPPLQELWNETKAIYLSEKAAYRDPISDPASDPTLGLDKEKN